VTRIRLLVAVVTTLVLLAACHAVPVSPAPPIKRVTLNGAGISYVDDGSGEAIMHFVAKHPATADGRGDAGPAAPFAAAVRKTIVNGAEISYVEHGAGEPVILLHGVGTDLRIWEDVQPYLGRGFRFVAYSRRHHAPNAWPDDGRTHRLATHVEDLAAFIRALGVDKAHIVGVSLGGRVAAEMVLAHPELVASAIINDSLVGAPESVEAQAVLQDFFRPFAALDQAVKAGNAPAAAVALVDWLYQSPGAWNAMPEHRKAYYRDNAPTLAPALRNDAATPRPTCEAIGRVRLPVMVMDGTETPLAFRITNDALFACLTGGAERAHIPRAGHFWYVDNPRGGAEVILRFLASHALPR
jgi:pimeloyl-ACP methyl ester carboxylesterase